MIIEGDCLEEMRKIADNSVSCIVTDPPYGLGFMGKEWDAGLPHAEIWKEAIRIVKPGGHLLSFGGTRTYHRLTCAIEDAGWEIRDCLMYLYGSGFPKSHNFGCRCTGDAVPYNHEKDTESSSKSSMRSMPETDISSSISNRAPENEVVFPFMSEQSLQGDWPMSFERNENGKESGMERGSHLQKDKGKLYRSEVCEMSKRVPSDVQKGRICNGTSISNGEKFGSNTSEERSCTSQRSQHTKQSNRESGTISEQSNSQDCGMGTCKKCGRLKGWGSWGTALKPAYEPIIMAMKPCEGTFANNAEKWGQAGINIDGCRIPTNDKLGGGAQNGSTSHSDGWDRPWKNDKDHLARHADIVRENVKKSESLGRWPANVLFDEEAAKALGNPSRFFYCAKASSRERNEGLESLEPKFLATMGDGIGKREHNPSQSKAWVKNNHPTVKPLKLMEYLITLVMPPKGGVLLDPFAGSGTTILAAKRLGFDAIGIEKSPDYCAIARARIENYHPQAVGE